MKCWLSGSDEGMIRMEGGTIEVELNDGGDWQCYSSLDFYNCLYT